MTSVKIALDADTRFTTPVVKGGQVQKLNGNSTVCPHCGANLVGTPIPEKSRPPFGGATHFLRVVGIEERDDDFISAYQCPDCGVKDSRF